MQKELESNQIRCRTHPLAGEPITVIVYFLFVGADGIEPPTHAGYQIYSLATNRSS